MSAAKNKLIEVQDNNSGLHGQYKSWFLDYASYVILERAVPAVEDGLKTSTTPHTSRDEGNG